MTDTGNPRTGVGGKRRRLQLRPSLLVALLALVLVTERAERP